MSEKRTGSMLCPDCGQLISVNAESCIHCGRKNPGMWGLTPLIRRWLGGAFGVVPAVITVCVALYILCLMLDPSAIMQPRGMMSLLSPSLKSLYLLGATGTFPLQQGRWWTLITAIYLHGGILHIFFNLLWVRQIGPTVEEFFGTSRLILIFTISGVIGFIVSSLFGVPFTIGASGSIFGLLGAMVYYGRHRGGAFGSAVYRQIGQWALILFVLGFVMPGVNNWAHGGGFAGGYLTAMFVGYSEQRSESFTHQILALGCVALTVISFALVIWAGFL
jgi:rhomboid protease GluP